MSMVGAKLLHLKEKSCRDIFPNVNKYFRDIHVYMFSDFRRSLPVRDALLYNNTFSVTSTS